jgi:hypothetical protein
MVASGSTMTNSEPSASRMYSDRLKAVELGTDSSESQTRKTNSPLPADNPDFPPA